MNRTQKVTFVKQTNLNPQKVLTSGRGIVFAVFMVVLVFSSCPAQALLVNLDIFNYDGPPAQKPDIDIYAVITGDENRAFFTVYNDSSIQSSVAGLYFEDGVLSGIAGFEFGPGTEFDAQANPKKMPAANTLSPKFTSAYGADSRPSTYHNGINPGEYMTVIFNFDAGSTFNDLQSQLESSAVRFGAHIIGFADGSSYSAVSVVQNYQPVPEPATLMLLAIGSVLFMPKKRP